MHSSLKVWVFTVHYIQGFPYFCEGSTASLAEPMPKQIAQEKRNVDRFLTYIVREDSQSIL